MAQQKYVALLRGINVGGHHKVPMAELRQTFEAMGFTQVKTLLNSGNVIFGGTDEPVQPLEKKIADQLENTFGFPVPVLIRKSDDIQQIIALDPFKTIDVHKDIRLYVTFLQEMPEEIPQVPWVSPDGSFQIIEISNRVVCSVLDVSQSKTTESMNILGKYFGKNVTTRNWNTILKIADKLFFQNR